MDGKEMRSMVSLKYPAIYTDSIGCEKCVVYLSDKNFQLKVRGFNFYSDQNDFDFYCESINEAKKHFYIKDNELIDYVFLLHLYFHNKNPNTPNLSLIHI